MALDRQEAENIAKLAALETAEPIHEKVNEVGKDVARIATSVEAIAQTQTQNGVALGALGSRVQTAECWIDRLKTRWKVLVGVFIGIAGVVAVLGEVFEIWGKLWS